MTPFDSWYSTHIVPELEQTLARVPEPARVVMRKAAREQMAACWNAAIREVENYCDEGLEHIPSLDKLRAQVTP